MADNLSYQLKLHASHHSQSSNRASATAAVVTATQAKAEAAKAPLAFIDRELKIKMLEKLQLKKKFTAIAKAETLRDSH